MYLLSITELHGLRSPKLSYALTVLTLCSQLLLDFLLISFSAQFFLGAYVAREISLLPLTVIEVVAGRSAPS